MIRISKKLARTLIAAGAVAAVPAMAQAEAAKTDVLSLSASATTEVARDLLQLRFSTTREGKEAGAVQNELKQALDAALAEARKVAKPGQVDLQAGNLSVYPRYGQTKSGGSGAPQITGWQGSVELLVQGRDMETISKLSGRIQTLSIANVSYGLSREAREKAEGEVVSQAIASYKAKAALYAQQFGYGGYRVGEVSVNADQPMPVMAPPMARFKSMAASADEALPVESGKATVTVNVSGSVLMTR
ncbi:SIMPL domain-containing protein [Mitsuaria sp. GD03876]|uniref:SIMPL domain-containing protein n=1 Tax=Mitsuaria sp. GD03876 TaxID=2975399 RepID=UPI00244B5988|nr:SIMPL domain-containing protein [Mitsuaria sp. GD03876]MDH0866255.1 SIMPL domain-containing protein [Mitsuaria sp. GD03876]